jgi:hypothetical protein
MVDKDEWGRDPSVQAMRKVFSTMEMDQNAFLQKLQISFFDERIRRWRDRALIIFEKMWGHASQIGIPLDEQRASDIYIFSLARVMNLDNMKISEEVLPKDRELEKIFKETFS